MKAGGGFNIGGVLQQLFVPDKHLIQGARTLIRQIVGVVIGVEHYGVFCTGHPTGDSVPVLPT